MTSDGRTYRVVELVGTSPNNIEDAIQNGIETAAGSAQELDWFEVREIRGRIEQGSVGWYQVKMGIGFYVSGPSEAV